MKFGRSYQMSVDGNYGNDVAASEVNPIVITFPTTLELNIVHNIFASANVGDFSMYGLSSTNRQLISFNQFLKPQPYSVVLRAGYLSQVAGGLLGSPSSLPIVFNGYANIAYTERSGPDLITRLNAFDNGDFTTGQPSAYFNPTNAYTAPAGAFFEEIVEELVSRLTGNVQFGGVFVNSGQLPDPLTRKQPFSGNVWTNLQTMAKSVKGGGAHVYIENGICYMVGQDNTLPISASLGTLSSETGLLGIPRYTGPTIMVSCVFEPSLIVGGQIDLLSSVNTSANGPCKIIAYTHRGTISGVVSGELTSDITLMQLSTTLGAIQQ